MTYASEIWVTDEENEYGENREMGAGDTAKDIRLYEGGMQLEKPDE